ncbi:TetR/AcrR family transcriptional regulator [Actinophytocola algeriensis]|uniref:AcrR family transcriptional regulator n=1 Tax=Actinophytocola algeriensis TaxID=1768010 RepID=A0A7W7VG15_9PSEU|nr:TetR/AcrR family transcriptional regulator [Actinophytocola algeriensis]MBB4908669.1 AcrR family transcriptional regulator [Actinophytocola algeriensis]MBE1474944.1 AcrR family transcriptional regulator [Actinophytocola algeriensis]
MTDTRGQILDATATLLERTGAEEVSIRDVCQAAGVTAPTVYHHFGDKKALLEAVAAEGFKRYLSAKRSRRPSADPLDDLHRGWADHVGFGLEHPAFYRLMYGTPDAEDRPPAREGHRVLVGILERLAEAGRLRLPPEQAATTIHTGAVGTTLSLLSTPEGPRTAGLADRMRDAVFGAVLHQNEPPDGKGTAAAELARALLATLSVRHTAELTPGERGILLELLGKLAP